MMIINRENYEAFLLDLMEGNLSVDQENILRHFLEENPDLTVEDNIKDLKLPDNGRIPVSGVAFPLKEELKKGGMNSEINAGNYEQFCIARLEGDLSGKDESRLDKFLSENPGPGKSAETFRFLILKADSSVLFPGKNTLKKGNNATVALKNYFTGRNLYKAVSIAASVAIMITVFNLLSDNFVTDKTFTQDNRNVNINDDQSSTSEPDAVTVPDTSPGGLSVVSAADAGIEFREIPRPEMNVHQSSVTEVKTPDILHNVASREPVLLPAKNISPLEVKVIRPDFSPEFVKPLQIAANQGEQQNMERTGAGRMLNGLFAFATRNVDIDEDAGGLNLWNIADAGFRGINSLTGADLRLEREFNQEGELVSLAFSSKVLEFRRTTSSKEN